MAGDPWEWFRWAEYDLEAGKFLFNGRRNFYASFMGYTKGRKSGQSEKS